MAHSIGLKIDHELPVGNVDVKIVVTRDGDRLGVVKISRGSIDWKPGKAKRTWSLTWQQFDDLMRETRPPAPLRNSRTWLKSEPGSGQFRTWFAFPTRFSSIELRRLRPHG